MDCKNLETLYLTMSMLLIFRNLLGENVFELIK